MAHLLLVEDDPEIGAALQGQLESHRHSVVWERTGSSAIFEADDRTFDLILLDLGLPDLDGFDVCRQLRSAQPAAVLVILSASSAEIDVVVSLEAGADDYLTKPFRAGELLARVRAHLRRGTTASSSPTVLRIGELEIDKVARTARIAGNKLSLRAKEFDLLTRLAADPGVTVSRTTLLNDVWGEAFAGTQKTLDVQMSALRRTLSAGTSHVPRPPSITTVRGEGYRLDA